MKVCVCAACNQWHQDARNHAKNAKCTNYNHCICCIGCQMSCEGCNHFQILADNYKDIHYAANCTLTTKYDLQTKEEEWEIIKNPIMQLTGQFNNCHIVIH